VHVQAVHPLATLIFVTLGLVYFFFVFTGQCLALFSLIVLSVLSGFVWQ